MPYLFQELGLRQLFVTEHSEVNRDEALESTEKRVNNP